MKVSRLQCEYQDNIIGSEIRNPRFSWMIEGEQRGIIQSAYRLQLATDDQFQDILWDTEKLEDSSSINITYEGNAIVSLKRYYARVKVWTEDGCESDWSGHTIFETAFLNRDEWKAKWIKPAWERTQEPDDRGKGCYFRRDFSAEKEVVAARIYATAQGMYDLYVNGDRVGDEYFTPHWTYYEKRLLYQTYDITDMIRKGGNTVGGILADGWYHGRINWSKEEGYHGLDIGFKAELHLHYADGTGEVVMTDDSWKYTEGPVRMADIWDGEIYDARLEMDGWSKPDFNASSWETPIDGVEIQAFLQADEGAPVKIMDEITPISIFKTPKGEPLIDFGQNMVGWVEFLVDAPEGTKYDMQFAEVLNKDGNFYNDNYRTAKCYCQYISNGKKAKWHPNFTFYGFRYVKLIDWPCEPQLDQFKGLVVHSAFDVTSTFQCSNPLVNKLQENIIWGQKGNFVDVPTDCPQRDERYGWTGDAQAFASTACFNTSVNPFYTKWMHDVILNQTEDGRLPCIVPCIGGEWGGPTGWIDVVSILPWTLWKLYGDRRIVEESYTAVKKWVDYMHSKDEEWVNSWHFGDWLALDVPFESYVGKTEIAYIARCFQIYSTKLFIEMANMLGKVEDVQKYSSIKNRLIHQFRTEYVTPNGKIAQNTQTAQVLALYFDLLDEKDRQRVGNDLVDLIERDGGHLTTGFLGTPYLNFALTQTGHLDVAYQLLEKEDYPSWLYPISKGATTIWEHWDGIKPDGTMWSDAMNSFNHYAYGAVGDWMYKTILGINPASEGYRKSVVQPKRGGSLTYAKGGMETVYGLLYSEWKVSEKNHIEHALDMKVIIPANTVSTIIIEDIETDTLTENGKDIKTGNGITEIKIEKNKAIITVKSGAYCFNANCLNHIQRR